MDDNHPSEQIRALVYLQHSIQDARTNSSGDRQAVSRRMHYMEIPPEGQVLCITQADCVAFEIESEQEVLQ